MIFIDMNATEEVVYQLEAILFRPWCGKPYENVFIRH